jgi:hypothetical protein
MGVAPNATGQGPRAVHRDASKAFREGGRRSATGIATTLQGGRARRGA